MKQRVQQSIRTTDSEMLCSIVACAIWNQQSDDCAVADWEKLLVEAKGQAVVALAQYVGLSKEGFLSPEQKKKNREELFKLFIRNEQMMAAQKRIVDAMQEAGIGCAILKGSSVSVCYPKPEMRSLGDIDLLIRVNDIDKACNLLREQGFIKLHDDPGYHLSFCLKGIDVELHYAVSTFPDSPGGRAAQRILSNCLNEVQQLTLDRYTFPALSNRHQAMSLLLHMERHMTSSGIGLRQLCDWAVFVAYISAEEFAEEIIPLLKECGLLHFAKIMTKVCVMYLGLEPEKAPWCMDADDGLCRTTMENILQSGNFGRAAEQDDMSELMVERSGSEGVLRTFLKRMNQRAQSRYPLVKKLPVLLPLFWVYIPLRYWVRSLLGLRPRKSIIKSVSAAQGKNRLYKSYRLFDV